MIGTIRGVIQDKQANEILVETGGVGYEVHVPMTTLFRLPEVGSEIRLYTHFVVRDDAQLLYGFVDTKERSLFRTLIRVNGIGPRMALTIMSGMDSDEFVRCIQDEDINALIKLPGIGRKTAQRLVIEVRDRLSEWDLLAEAGKGAPGVTDNASLRTREAEGALVALGYKPGDAAKAIKSAQKQLEAEGLAPSSELLIRSALRNKG